ncbi:MAG: GGDEF domain-containing protein [Bacilli bacterium]|nr:GGDEF domain-containing protein [Bacilli bacterium]
MRKKKNNKWLVIGLITLLVIILIVLINFSRGPGDNTKLNLTEKKWIENNKKDVINVSVANNIPAFSGEGEGVFFDYVSKLEEETGLSFNLISYDAFSEAEENDLYFEVVGPEDVNGLKDSEMVFYKDYYVLVGKESEKISEPTSIRNKNIGVLKDDLADVSYYVSSNNGVTYKPYENDEELQKALKDGNVDYVAVPKTRCLSFILENNYHVVYNVTEMREAYVLRTSKGVNEHLASIVKKNFLKYKNNELEKKYNESLIDVLMTKNNISEKSKADFLSKKYVFGYLENDPYTNVINNKLIGLDSTYVNLFSELSGATFTIRKYRSVKDLTKDLNAGKVDVAPNYYNYSGLSGNYARTISPYDEQYVVLIDNKRTDVVVNSVKSLRDKKVMTTNSTLAKYLEKEGKAKVTAYDKIETLISKMDKNSIVVLDKNVFEMYKDSELANYRVIYSDKENLEYGYIIKDTNENSTFKTLFTTYMETINYKQIYNVAWKEFSIDSKEISYGFLYVIGVLIVAFIIWLFAKKKLKVKKKNKREETIRYIDPLTSLKNRNYLNKNFKRWEENAIYPQSIIVINLNNLRHVNDVYGHEEGDKLIKLAANILIRNQLEQSDIIRTDGNEYLIYMVGYEKNKVVAYMRKLYKELSELPYGYGATLGYSMIEDDIKTIDDAINEAVLEIRANKEMNSKGK